MRNLLRLCVVSLVLMLGACAEAPPVGPPPPLSLSLARIYFFREINWNAPMIWTPVSLNDRPAGNSEPGTYFFRDVEPGTYRITVRSQRIYPNQFQTLTATAGGTYYVRIYALEYAAYIDLMDQEYTFLDQIVSPEEGQHELAALRAVAG
jgi:hypothetical protein